MAISIDRFTQQLADSGLMSSDELVSFVDGLPASNGAPDVRQLARELVRQIYSDRSKSLVLGNYASRTRYCGGSDHRSRRIGDVRR